MSDVLTRGDSLRWYLTGAGSDGGAQTDPNACFGHYRSSTEAVSMGISITSAIANITVNYASGGNALGAGTLQCVDANTLQWQDAGGGGYGPAVAIANGESKVLEINGNAGAFLRVTRTSATALVPGTSTITLTQLMNNFFGYDDILSVEASGGYDDYRATIVKNVASNNTTLFKIWIGQLGTSNTSDIAQLGASGAGTIQISTGNFNDWPTKGWCQVQTSGGTLKEIVYYSSRTSTVLTVPAFGRGRLSTSATAGSNTDLIFAVPGLAVGLDNANVQAAGSSIQTIAGETSVPTLAAPGWYVGITAATGIAIGTLTPGDQVGIWLHREIPAGTVANTLESNILNASYDAV